MIRTLLIAAGALALAAGAIAQSATTWTDADKTFSFDNAKKWPVDTMTPPGAPFVRYVAGTANEECTFQSIPRPQSEGRSPASVKGEFAKPLSADLWLQISGSVPYFSMPTKITPTIVESSVDTSGAWPVQIATLKGKDDAVITAALHARPGRDIWVYCQSFDGKDRKADFLTIAKSVSTPKDAELAASEAAAAAQASDAAAKAAAAEAAKKKR